MQKYSLSINEKGRRPNLLSNISFLWVFFLLRINSD
jgi:hypothetical protein